MKNSSKILVNLTEVNSSNTLLVGGKAASLGEMLRAKLPVPPGFVLTTEAFRQGMSADLKQQILETFDGLGAERVAVRSSAVAEDSSDASWAGQLETVLSVTRDGVISAVKHCWDSIQSERAQSYARDHKVSQTDQAVAVVIQTMVPSDVSGVMFTANPVSGNSKELIIEAIYGLGELLVQGTVTPESIVMEKKTGGVTTRSDHQQKKKLIYKDGKNIEVPLRPNEEKRPILSQKQLTELRELATKIENHYSSPQDIEWAIAGNKTYIVQSRPITTQALSLKQSITLPEWAEDEIFQWGPIRGRYFYISDFVVACYSALHKSYPGEYFPEALLLFNDNHMIWLSNLTEFVDNGKRVFSQYMQDDKMRTDMYSDWQKKVRALTRLQANITTTDLTKFSDQELHTLWQQFYEAVIDFWVPTLLPELGNYGAPSTLKDQLARVIEDETELTAALETLTAPEELSFYQVEELELAKTSDIGTHQNKYFWLKNSYGEVQVLSEKFFRDRKRELTADLKSESGTRIAEAQRKNKLKLQKKYKLTSELKKQADIIAENVVWQDERKRYATENFHFKGLFLNEVARRRNIEPGTLLSYSFEDVGDLLLVKQHDLPARGSCFGVSFHTELHDLPKDTATELWDRYTRAKSLTNKIIKGVTASRGSETLVRGVVRVLHSSHAILEPGEILVTSMTSPGYIFAMRQAKAVITDVGGLTSHAAIVSRELNIPCIVGTKVATKLLHDGDIVEVDSAKGTVRVVEKLKNTKR